MPTFRFHVYRIRGDRLVVDRYVDVTAITRRAAKAQARQDAKLQSNETLAARGYRLRGVGDYRP